MTLLEAALAAIARGWCLTPLNKKIPVNKGWQKAPRPTEQQVRDWIQMGYGLGVRTGPASGIVVLDLDPGAEWTPDMFPDAALVKTPRGFHLIYAATDPCPKNSAGKLAKGVDVRGAGGQIALPGTDDRPWIRDVPPPPWPFPVETPKPRPSRSPVHAGSNAWANKALNVECEQLAAAQEGTRHDRLNIAAFNLGQIVAGGALDHATVADTLTSIGLQIGLDEKDVTRTVADGLEAGAKTPRTPPVRPPPVHVEIEDEPSATDPAIEIQPAPVAEASPKKKRALVKIDAPGEHWEGGAARSVSNARFAYQVLKALEPGDLYRRLGVVGFVRGATFEPATPHDIRLLIDNRVIIFEHPMMTTRQLKEVQYVTSSVDHASIILAAAKTSKYVRDLEILSPHPIVTPEREVLYHGWHEKHKALVVCDIDFENVVPVPIWEPLTDFKFADESSKAALLGMFLSPFFRALLNGNCPLHMITAPTERSGKTKIVDEILGIILGLDIGMMTWTDDEEEIRKRILAMILSGKSVICIDNIPATFESHALASLLTARSISDRLLGQSTFVTAPNRLVIIATGNNTEASSEVAKRALVTRIDPGSESPESRTDFKYADLLAYVVANRAGLLKWLLDLCQNGPLGTCPPMGGFERWIALPGRIVCGQGLQLSTGASLPVKATDDLAPLFAQWLVHFGEAEVGTSDLLPVAAAIEWGGNALDPAKSTRSQVTWLGSKLATHVGRVHNGVRLERSQGRKTTLWRLRIL